SLLFLLICAFTFAQIQKVEPAFWWKGMKNPELQILVYGKNITKYSVELSDKIQVKDLTKTENPNYLFITVNTNEINTSTFKINCKEKNKTVYTNNYEVIVRNTDSVKGVAYSSKDVMYLIMLVRFVNGDVSINSQAMLNEKA